MKKKGYFDEFGIEVTKENAEAIEREIGVTMGVADESCPSIWREVKVWLEDEVKRADLGTRLKEKFSG